MSVISPIQLISPVVVCILHNLISEKTIISIAWLIS